MSKKFLTLAVGLCFAGAELAQAASVSVSMTSRPVSPAEAGDGAPAGGTVFDFFAMTDNDIVSVDQVNIAPSAAALYQNLAFGSNVEPPNPGLIPIFPSLSADSWISTPGVTATALPGDFSAANNSWFDTSNDGAQGNFNFARLTFAPGTVPNWGFSGRVNINDGAGGVFNQPFVFPMVVSNTPPDVTPDGGTRGTRANRMFMQQFVGTDAEDGANLDWMIVSFDGPTVPANFGIDNTGKFSWDTAGVPEGFDQVYHLVVKATDHGPGDPLSDQGDIFITLPEPGTFVLAGMSLIGILASRRKVA